MLPHLDEIVRTVRRLRRAPGFTAAVVLSIALGVGSFVSIYSVLDTVLWEAMPYEDPERLAYVWRNYTWAEFPRGWAGGVEILGMRDSADAVEQVAGVRGGSVNLSSRDGGEPREVEVTLTTANFFDLIGTQPSVGRGFAPGEDVEGAPLVAVLGHQLWQQRYGADPGIVGRTIFIDDEPAEVIGVMPESFHFAMHSSLGAPRSGEAFLNLRWDLSQVEGGSLAALIRVREGTTQELLQSQLDAVAQPIDRDIFDSLGLRLWPAFLHEDLVKDVRPALLAIIAAAAFLLVILGVNLATLLLGRATRRAPELAVSGALGASRGALLRESLVESLMLALGGGALGLLLAQAGTAVIAELAVDLPRRHAIDVDGSAALTALGAAALLGIAAGIAPAWRAARTDVGGALRRAGGRVTGGRTTGGLVVAQVAISLMLLAGAGVLTRSFLYLIRSEPGFDARNVLTVKIPVTPERYPEAADVTGYYRRIVDGIEALPGVDAVGGVNALPLTRATSQNAVAFPGSGVNAGGDEYTPLVDWFAATPGYFEAMGVPILAGRDFTDGDDDQAPGVAIIDDTLAQRFFDGYDAIGQMMTFFGRELTVVAIVDQPRLYDIHQDDRGQVFLPLAQRPAYGISLAIRADRDPGSLIAEVREVVRSIDADQPLADVRTMQQVTGESLSGERLSLGLIAGFALGALLLATLGLYGVLSNVVSCRTREMGLRMALGADAARVRGLVVRQGMRLALIGTALGLLGSLVTARFLESLLVGVEPADPVTLAVVSAAMAATAFVTCYIPARRASSVDPMVALRTE